ncbi:hypothetical protein BC6307_02940 [Sutcliffiella cohnii]|uniref:Putative amidase domain-containing protein n=1 Tax=Sutcliffiella cohnii TaxID=33932 RepID=A0A223KLL9_9BACI|nr:amidase domain-containing protein [Sutcliffiella cohnii]AST90296.1 hypothetical protein BC6307_02940 [Sutcliffiella cohnii]
MNTQLKRHVEMLLQSYVYRSSQTGNYIINDDTIKNKREMHRRRGAEIVKCNAEGKINKITSIGNQKEVTYQIHIRYLINHKDKLYLEEEMLNRISVWDDNEIVTDRQVMNNVEPIYMQPIEECEERDYRFTYDRMAAVQYAERWWNSYNPQFKKFDVDCTNYVSQCVHAGGAPMVGFPNKSSGWWMKNKAWSYTWSVAHSLRWYIPNAKSGMKGREVTRAADLMPGDVICYDFQGDGRFDHNTIVVAKDQDGMPLVNAHTHNSRMRYWAYEDSSAYTPNIKYKFFHIIDRN